METGKNSNNKLLKIIGYGLAIVGFGLWARHAYKKEFEKVVEEEEKPKPENEIKNANTPDENPDVEKTEQVVSTVVEEEEELEGNFIKDLYDEVRSESSEIDECFIDPYKFCKAKKKILHVMESLDKNSGNVFLKVMLEVPKYTNSLGNYNMLRIQDIIRDCKDSGKYVTAQILRRGKNEEPAWSKVVAVMEYSYAVTGSDTRKFQLLEVPNWILRKVYEDSEDQEGKKANMAVRFFEDSSDSEKLVEIDKKVGDDIKALIYKDALRKADDDGDVVVPDSIDPSPCELMYSIGFQRKNIFSKEKEIFEMTLTQACEIIDYYINTFVIRRTGKKMIPGSPVPVDEIIDEFYIDGVMFQAPNRRGRFDSLLRYYYTKENGKVGIDSFNNEPVEEEVEEEPEREVTEADLEALKNAKSTKIK